MQKDETYHLLVKSDYYIVEWKKNKISRNIQEINRSRRYVYEELKIIRVMQNRSREGVPVFKVIGTK